MTTPTPQDEARRILVDIAKHKGYFDESFTNFVVTAEELAPYIAKLQYQGAAHKTLQAYLDAGGTDDFVIISRGDLERNAPESEDTPLKDTRGLTT